MRDERKAKSQMLIRWILKAFFAFVPKITGGRMGTALIRDKGRAVPADFLPNLRNFLVFSSPTYDLRPTTYCVFAAAPQIAHLCSSPKSFCPSLGSFSYSQTTFRYSPKSFSPSPARFCPSLGRVLSQS